MNNKETSIKRRKHNRINLSYTDKEFKIAKENFNIYKKQGGEILTLTAFISELSLINQPIVYKNIFSNKDLMPLR